MRRKVFPRDRRDIVRPLAPTLAYVDEHGHAVGDLGGVTAGSYTGCVDITAQVREALDGVPVRGEPRVPRIDVRKGDSEHPDAIRAKHDRHAAARRRQQDGVVGVLELTVERDVLPGEQPPHDLEGLLEPGDGAVERKAERAELRLVPSSTEAEHKAPARDLVDRCRHPRDQAGRMKRGGRDERPETHPFRDRGERGELRPCIPRPSVGQPAAPVQVVIADPDRLESRLLRGPRDSGDLRPAHHTLDFRELDTYTHRGRRYRVRR